jgi:lipopolysaccharide transport system ATP-binding protein
MTATVIRAEGLSKSYRLGVQGARHGLLREAVASSFAHPFRTARDLLDRWRSPRSGKDDRVWALRDVGFEVRQGEVLGIVGANGAGKSTLLKVLSRITRPTSGWAEIRGRVGSLLEVGAGFHAELTGRENVFLSGAILGMRKSDITRRFDEIVAFAGVERFLDTPVKHYSSGMYVRLAFAIAAHMEPEILIVDEVLSVGDLAFQNKCLGRMGDVAREGRTVLFVSHALGTVRRLCSRVGLLERGELRTVGEPDEVLDAYVRSSVGEVAVRGMPPPADTDAPGRLTRIEVSSVTGEGRAEFRMGEPFRVRLHAEAWRPMDHVVAAFAVTTLDGTPIVAYRSRPARLVPGRYAMEVEVSFPLAAATLLLRAALWSNDAAVHTVEGAARVVISEIAVGSQPHSAAGGGLLFPQEGFEIRAAEGDAGVR